VIVINTHAWHRSDGHCLPPSLAQPGRRYRPAITSSPSTLACQARDRRVSH